ncbi:MAG: hypothetical protein M3337_05300 [Actinomycetota bacterium]|nr:hypothetical protein [Actinomycetota bacterium]
MTTNTSSQQLDLFPAPTLPARFRLSDDTVKRGRRHIAEIRKMLASSHHDYELDGTTPIPKRHQGPPRAA